jgi:hypothetical protein
MLDAKNWAIAVDNVNGSKILVIYFQKIKKSNSVNVCDRLNIIFDIIAEGFRNFHRKVLLATVFSIIFPIYYFNCSIVEVLVLGIPHSILWVFAGYTTFKLMSIIERIAQKRVGFQLLVHQLKKQQKT